jgi:formylglycine-generating enzyme required for sulfatase activity
VREAATALAQLRSEVRLSETEQAFLGPIDPTAMLAELQRPETSHHHRALIGERLAVLGDPREGVGLGADCTPQIAWCEVPGGEVSIQVKRLVFKGTKPRSKQIAGFRIARYPITVAQYRAFLQAEDGWRDPRWWADDLYQDPEGESYDFGRYGNHPAVYVSWFDALAFCRWLGQRLGLALRLPNEWEWQQAASGGDPANAYPWGADWDPKREPFRANTFESRLGAVTAVGMYPAGASPEGVLDMAGTVWEWCLNQYDIPEISESRRDDFASRVLRGGSWANIQDLARAVYRSNSPPDYRYDLYGFRVVCASPIR